MSSTIQQYFLLLEEIIYKDSLDFTTEEGSHSSLSLKQVFNENK